MAKEITDSLVSSGAKVNHLAYSGGRYRLPIHLDVSFATGESRQFLIYIWTVSHGGRSRAGAEFRIQTKLPAERRLRFGVAVTVLFGLYSHDLPVDPSADRPPIPPNTKIFVAWDPISHLHLGSSSSCQVRAELLFRAYLDDIAAYERPVKAGSEQVIAFVPGKLAWYLRHVGGGHDSLDVEMI